MSHEVEAWKAVAGFFFVLSVVQQILVHHVLHICQKAVDLMMEKP